MGLTQKNKKIITWILVLSLIGLTGFLAGKYWLAPLLTADEGGGPTATDRSTFIIRNGASGDLEDISNICELDILVPTSSATFDTEDDYHNPANFKVEINNDEAEDISLDLSEYEAVWCVISADTPTVDYWTEDWKLIKPSGANRVYTYDAHHRSSDVYGNFLNDATGDEFDGTTDMNATFYLWFPTQTFSDYHWDANENWAIQGAWADLSANTISKLQNERWWREQEIVFDLDDNTADMDRVGDYRDVTNIPSIKFTFNDTIGADASVTDVNLTVDSNIEYYLEFSGQYAYINFMESWDVYYFTFELPVEISMGANITCSQIDFGRNAIPGNHFADSHTFTSLQVLYT